MFFITTRVAQPNTRGSYLLHVEQMSTNKGDDYLYTTWIKTDVQVTWLDLENCGRFPFHQTFENLETATNGTQKCPGKIDEKLLNFRDANPSTENSRNCGSKVEWK